MIDTEHLTPIEGATLIAWHRSQDVQAVQMPDMTDRLYVFGRYVPLTEAHHSPVQQVINYCRAGKRDQGRMRAMWLDIISKA